MKKSIITKIRDAVSGRYTTAQDAAARPRETVRETVKRELGDPVRTFQTVADAMKGASPGEVVRVINAPDDSRYMQFGSPIDAPSTPGNSKPVRPGMKEFASLNQARREAMPGETVRINGYNVVVPPSPVVTPPGYGRVLPTLSPMPSHKQEEAIMQAIQDALNHGDCTGTDILRGYQVAGVMIIVALDRAGFTVAKK